MYNSESFQRCTKNRKSRDFFLGDEGKASNIWVCVTELARIYRHFNFVLILKWIYNVVREGNTVLSKVKSVGTTYRLPEYRYLTVIFQRWYLWSKWAIWYVRSVYVTIMKLQEIKCKSLLTSTIQHTTSRPMWLKTSTDHIYHEILSLELMSLN